ncbi:MAG: hypothetical protein HY377_00175 [Candidatus Blackburnbacteria bacterium]|nr:hypothetical protein [Candidatus Blackburnbacteria bacterium]
MKKVLYLLTFFLVTPITLATSIFALSALSRSDTKQATQGTLLTAFNTPRFAPQIYSSLTDTSGEVLGSATSADARGEIVRLYLEKYNSPLRPYAQTLVEAAEKYNLDFRLLVAIAQQESNLCKKIPSDSYNCWGWGIHSQGTLRFESYAEAIEAVARGLREDYFDKGYTTPEEIMSKYTPLSPGTWALGVHQFLAEME